MDTSKYCSESISSLIGTQVHNYTLQTRLDDLFTTFLFDLKDRQHRTPPGRTHITVPPKSSLNPHSLLNQYIFKRIKPWSTWAAFFFLTFPTVMAKLPENIKATMAFHMLFSHSVQEWMISKLYPKNIQNYGKIYINPPQLQIFSLSLSIISIWFWIPQSCNFSVISEVLHPYGYLCKKGTGKN